MFDEQAFTVIEPVVDKRFVATPFVKDLADQALSYLKADLPVHFSGPAGTGKSSLAMYVAARWGRPIVVIHGDEEFKTSDLVGAEYGYRLKRVRDQYISTVKKVEEDYAKKWMDNRLTVAVKNGFTLIYDEFTRSRPEANNVLLAILEEKMLELPSIGSEETYLRVDPNFRSIFTSNPEEYAGIYKAQDALRDRLMTVHLGFFDEETETAIVKARSGLSEAEAKRIVKLVRRFRVLGNHTHPPSVRESIKIAKVLKTAQKKPSKRDPFFTKLCLNVLTNENHLPDLRKGNKGKNLQVLNRLIHRFC
jgi:gas vesicle protein GvpN